MGLLSSSELADALGVTRARVSQLVAEGKLAGCFAGDGRARRFDLEKVAVTLNRVLDRGQMMGNGAGTRRALRDLMATEDEDEAGAQAEAVPAPAQAPRRAVQSDGPLPAGDPDRYELARTQKAEEEARKLRRQNEEAEGAYVLASEAAMQVSRLMAREIGGFEAVLQAGARAVADRLGVDYREARTILTECWREHRARRAGELGAEAAQAAMSADERAQDI